MLWMMDFTPQLRHDSDIPLYRQIFLHISAQIRSGELPSGERLPATRELAGLLGLNRATISAAYEMLETEGLIAGHVETGGVIAGRQAAKCTGRDVVDGERGAERLEFVEIE